jgi:hypothetical protein
MTTTSTHDDIAREFNANLDRQFAAFMASDATEDDARAFRDDLDKQFEDIMARLGPMPPTPVYTQEPEKPKHRRRSAPRPPRKMFTATCQTCKKNFIAFRKTARFCGPECYPSAVEKRRKRIDVLRHVEQTRGLRCYRCPKDSVWLRVRPGVSRATAKPDDLLPVCSTHFTEMSREMFWKRCGLAPVWWTLR